MKREHLIKLLAIVGVAALTGLAVYARAANAGHCLATPDGQFICKATGEVMPKPCCAIPSRAR